jgi:hypothetical protein
VKPRLAAVIFLFASGFGALSAMDAYIAPILYIDESNDRSQDSSFGQRDLLRELQAIETGMILNFYTLRDNAVNPPQSLIDAATLCRTQQLDYLLYGYITKRDYSIEGVINLFDYGMREIRISFYAMDDTEHYERMLTDLALKIVAYFNDTFNLGILPQKEEYMHLYIPASLGYWTPVGNDWHHLMTGIFALHSGIKFIPNDNLGVIYGRSFYLSTGLELSYRLGVGSDSTYKSFYHDIMMTIPLRFHTRLAERHEVFGEIGFLYALDFLSVSLKYENSDTKVYGNIGFALGLGYIFKFSERFNFFFDNTVDFQFMDNPIISYSPKFGIDIWMYSREIKRKW